MTILFIRHTDGLSWIKSHADHMDLSPGARRIRWLTALGVRLSPALANNATGAMP
ncbi:hypothetical protein SAMN05192562_108133 [Kosakonia arachidis]|uniref:Uncharacterized protein n=1 Tax=Kosakonia arachidis TaxID=551989 RepID=A0A1I7E1D5_9ENTR|nr:hypothetical protein SAMN05192562_108133 [Kosakonia arachidis]